MANSTARDLPTGCYKCGRPGHWSRDCPVSSAGTENAVGSGGVTKANTAGFGEGSGRPAGKSSLNGKPLQVSSADEVPPKLPRKRPTLTPDLLLSDNGLGYLLEKMPEMVKPRGVGHEVHDLKCLLEGYVQWHSQLHPYLGFNEFIAKVEKLGATRRVRMCVRELRDKVTGRAVRELPKGSVGEDRANADQPSEDNPDQPSKSSRQAPADKDVSCAAADLWEEYDHVDHNEASETRSTGEDSFIPLNDDDFEEFWKQGTSQTLGDLKPPQAPRTEGPTTSNADSGTLNQGEVRHTLKESSATDLDESLAARVEANRLKALERAKARRFQSGE